MVTTKTATTATKATKAKKGADDSKERTGQTKQQFQQIAQGKGVETFRTAVDAIRLALANYGYDIRPNNAGHFCKFDVYRLTEPHYLPGLELDRNFKQYRLVSLSDSIDRNEFYRTLSVVASELIAGADTETFGRNVLQSVSDFRDRPANPTSPTAQSAPGFREKLPLVTLTGRSGLTKFVPPADTFEPGITELKPEDLLTLWPDAERKFLVLMLGRILAGPRFEETAEGTVSHTWRSYGISIGREPGLGKSTFMMWLVEALEHLGYTTETINLSMGKFGWGRVALADLAYVDDLSDKSQGELMSSGTVKSLVSGHPIKTEEKGLSAETVTSRCVLMGCSNGSDPAAFLDMDPGSINRTNQLYTRTSHELEEVYGSDKDYRIKQRWEQLAAENQTTPVVLMCWLLRQSLDTFLEVSGHSLTERNTLTYCQDDDSLEPVIRGLRKDYVISVSLDHVDSLVEATVHGLAVYRAKVCKNTGLFDKLLHRLDFGPDVLMAALEFQQDVVKCDGYDGLVVKHLSNSVYTYLLPKLGSFRSRSASLSLPDMFKMLTGELVSTSGFKYPGGLTTYNEKFKAMLRDFPRLVAQYEKDGQALPEAVAKMAGDLGTQVLQ